MLGKQIISCLKVNLENNYKGIEMRKFATLFFALFTILGIAKAQQNNYEQDYFKTLIGSNTRFITNLGGQWDRSIDDGDSWQTVTLPYSEKYNNKVIFKRDFRIDKSVLNKYAWHLYFAGVDDQIEIEVNGQNIGKYSGGLTPFWVKIPSKILSADAVNKIELRVSALPTTSTLKKYMQFAPKSSYGVIRDIALIGSPRVWVSGLSFQTHTKAENNNFDTKIEALISTYEIDKAVFADSGAPQTSLNRSQLKVQAVIRNIGTREIISQDAEQNFEVNAEKTAPLVFNLNTNTASLWAIENPHLYEIAVKITRNGSLIDELTMPMGFKSLKFGLMNGIKSIALNNQPFQVKAVDYIEDFGDNGKTIYRERMEEDIKLIKTLGANTVRFKYNLPHPYFMRLCEKYGLMVLIEVPAYEIPKKYLRDDDIIVRMKNLAERIKLYYASSPALLAVGVASGMQEGCPEFDDYQTYLKSSLSGFIKIPLFKTVKFGAKTINSDGYDFIVLQADNPRRGIEYFKSEMTRLAGISGAKPIIANFGLPIQPDNNNGYSDLYSLESQARYLRDCYRMAQEVQSAGSIMYSFNDYSLNSPLMILLSGDLYKCHSGLVDSWRRQRLAYSAVQALFNDEKDPLISAGKYSEDIPLSFFGIGFIIAGVLFFQLNRYRRFREYFVRSLLRPYNFYADIRDQRILSTVHSIALGGLISLAFGMTISSLLFFYRKDILLQYWAQIFIDSPSIKEMLYRLIWNPELSMLFFAVVFYIKMLLIALLLKAIAFLVRARIFYSDTFAIGIWASIPLLALLPFAIAAIRALNMTTVYAYFLIFITAVLMIWSFLRILKSTAVVFDSRPTKIYIIGFSTVIVVLVGFFLMNNPQNSLLASAQYFFAVLWH